MTKTLTHHKNTFDQDSLFNLEVTDRRGTRNLICYAHDGRGYGECQPFINKQSAMIKDKYTDEDRATSARLANEAPVRHGEIVNLSGKAYRVNVTGDYMDAAKLIAV